MTILSAIILLGILIFVHELGHFLFAKLVNVKVLRFSLGFGPKLLGKQYGDTEYRISLVPLGGYVKMLGEEPEEELPEEDKARAYNHQSVWKRALIVSAGPAFNVFFAALVFMLIFGTGVPALFPDVGEVREGSPAETAGLRVGDRIIGIQGSQIKEWAEMTDIVYRSAGKSLDFKVRRDGDVLELAITPEPEKVKNIFGEEKEIGLIGIKAAGTQFTKKYSPLQAMRLGIKRTADLSVLTVVSIVKLIQRVIPAKTIGGPIFIVQMAGEQASQGITNFFVFMAIISINLAIINLLPIPVLDGGHLVFLLMEVLRRKPLSERAMIMFQKAGIAMVLTLMAFALYNDVIRILTGGQMQ